MPKKIRQDGYADIEVDTSEKDVVLLIGRERMYPQIVFVERKNISKLITILQNELKIE